MKIAIIILVLVTSSAFVIFSMMGSGGFKRMVTLTGIYAVCKPNGYEAICFLDADSNEGGLSCIPYSGECRK